MIICNLHKNIITLPILNLKYIYIFNIAILQVLVFIFWDHFRRIIIYYTMKTSQSQPSLKVNLSQVCLPVPLSHQQAAIVQQVTKRSDDEQFQDWQITNIKSGKFIFNPIDKPKPLPNQNTAKQSVQQSLSKKVSLLSKQSLVISANLKEKDSNVQVNVNTALLRLIFVHFCKQNHISSMKSTLFEDKPKLMQEMSLNKWMVFAKEFALLEKLSNNTITLPQMSPKTKDMKYSEITLTHIFKKCSEHQSKMRFQNFLQAIKMVYQKYQQKNLQNHLSEVEFVKQHLFCGSQKECKAKLSSLKFTFRIPQIDYTVFRARSISKSKCNLSSSKQNQQQMVRNRSTHATVKQKIKLNPIIRQSKSKIVNKASLQLSRKYIGKIKLTQQHKQRVVKNGLEQLIDGSKDDILEAYFKIQSK